MNGVRRHVATVLARDGQFGLSLKASLETLLAVVDLAEPGDRPASPVSDSRLHGREPSHMQRDFLIQSVRRALLPTSAA
jgi:hypothetical protein